MGLDITAYSRLTKATDVVLDDDGDPVDDGGYWRSDVGQFWPNEHFPGRADDIEPEAWYTWADEFDFRAGSYGGYSQWREQLARVAGYAPGKADPADMYADRFRYSDNVKNYPDGPFYELIWFTDCDGVIGAKVSAKLAADFAKYDEAASKVEDDTGWFYARYQDWRKAFELASDGGAVRFH